MGWGFRKSINLGPFRLNASKSGFGYSFGGRGFRFGRDAKGRKYRSLSIPGTGIYNRTYTKTASSTLPQTPKPTASTSSSGKGLVRVLLYFGAAWLIYLIVTAIHHLL